MHLFYIIYIMKKIPDLLYSDEKGHVYDEPDYQMAAFNGREYVIPLSKAAIAVGADGILVEVHHDPSHALSDGIQSLYPNQFRELVKEIASLKR